MQFKVKYGDEFEPIKILETKKDSMGQEFCTIELVDDPRVVLEVNVSDIKLVI